MKLEEVPVASFPAYQKFRAAMQSSQDLTVPLTSGVQSMFSYQEEIWNLPQSENADALKAYSEAQEEFKKGDVEAQIKAIQHAVALDPHYTRAWLWLGEQYKAQRQPDLAIAAYRKAIQIDPDQTVSHKALGLALLGVGKTAEATASARELIRIAPDDLIGHSLLAGALFALKQCGEAANEYEAAARLAPELAAIQIGLGRSRVCAGAPQKAVGPFRRAAELDPSPTTLNTVAYSLADENLAIDSALEYATKAVAEATADSRKIELSALEMKDLQPEFALQADWDTLGWVYIRLGKLTLAEEYLKAAWTLSQVAVIADHLGQVFERAGKKQEALHMYRLALKRYLSGAEGIEKTRERVEKLVPGSSALGPKEEQAIDNELSLMRTVKLPKLTTETASAEFFAVFTRDPKTGAAKIEGVKFIGGSDVLKKEVAAVQSASLPMSFPPEGQARILRRGVVGCFPLSGCSFTLLNIGDVHSVN
jgi:tetratricopeptide (TPR) repeat protein